jgi:hypothetical protein
MISRVPSEDLYIVWEAVEKLIKKALDDCYTSQDIYNGLQQDRFQLFISWENKKVESAVITEIANYPRKKICRYFLAGGNNMDNWLKPIQETIEKFAKKNGCRSIEVAGRKGWLRKLKGYKQKIYLMSKEL